MRPAASVEHLEDEDRELWDRSFTAFHDLTTATHFWRKLLPDAVEPMRQPESTKPVVQIAYGAEFDHAMNHARGLMESGEVSPRLLAALEIGLKFCPANYNFWKCRRDVVLCSRRFERACTFGLGLTPWNWRPSVEKPSQEELRQLVPEQRDRRWAEYEARFRRLRPYSYPPHLDGKLALLQHYSTEPRAKELDKFDAMCVGVAPMGDELLLRRRGDVALAPYERVVHATVSKFVTSAGKLEDAPGRPNCPSSDDDLIYDPWHAVAWELRTMRYTAVNIAKSFQTWNHRKELLLSAAARTSADYAAVWSGAIDQGHTPASSSDALAVGAATSHASCREGESACLNIGFEDFDERVLTAFALRNDDAKNYHAWSHRGWFVLWLGLAQDAEGLQTELDFTAELLLDDPFNNSAWSHRMLVLREALLNHVDDSHRAPSNVQEAGDGSYSGFPHYFPSRWAPSPRLPRDVAKRIRRPADIDTAVKLLHGELAVVEEHAAFDPRNESPFTYAAGLVRLAADVAKAHELSGDARLKDFVRTVLKTVGEMDVLAFCDDHPIVDASPERGATDGFADATTELLRQTHVALHRDGCLVQLFGFTRDNAAVLGFGDDYVAEAGPAMKRLAKGLAEVDSVRSKYWLSLA